MDDHKDIKVWGNQSRTGNVLWVRISRTRYAFSYNHETEEIEMRKGSMQGDTIHCFTNAMSLSELKSIFGTL